ncbi:MAG: twin-arginine translocase TatA/TatE family subunit [Actinobacteria bacterium]|nr:twin-arginine translocase TatA/TatE family subunit [Actinomycetota bacterium]
MPFGLGIWELVILAGVLVLLFGAKGATGAARSLGRSVREVQDAVKEVDPRRLLEPLEEEEERERTAAAPPAAPSATAAPRAATPPPTDAGGTQASTDSPA